MRITLDTAKFKAALTACERVAPRNSSIPVVSHVLLECLPTGLRLSVTDLETSRQEMLDYVDPAVSPADWSRCVDVRSLKALLPSTAKRTKATPTVTLMDASGDLQIVVGGAKNTLRGLPPEDFPALAFGTLDDGNTAAPAVVGGEHLRATIGKVFTSISAEESRFQLSGALFECRSDMIPADMAVPDADAMPKRPSSPEGALRIVATDGHTMARAETLYRIAPGSDLSLLVPRDVLDRLSRDVSFGPVKRPVQVRDENGEPVTFKSGKRKGERKTKNVATWPDVYMSVSAEHVYFEARSVRYAARILEGNFPDYVKVIKGDREADPPELTISTTVEDLLASLASVSHMTGDRARAIRLELGGDLPVFSAANPDAGQSSVELNGSTKMAGRLTWEPPKIPRRKHGMTPGEILCLTTLRESAKKARADGRPDTADSLGINPDYLANAVKCFAPESIVDLCFWDSCSQLVVRSLADPSFRSVIMPIRL